jgi:hypothetical protein
MQVAAQLGITRLCVDTDATLVKVALMENSYQLSAVGGIITEMKHLINSEFVSCKISVCKCDCNKVAHNLVAFGCTFPNGQINTWDDVPQEIEVLVISNLDGSDE